MSSGRNQSLPGEINFYRKHSLPKASKDEIKLQMNNGKLIKVKKMLTKMFGKIKKLRNTIDGQKNQKPEKNKTVKTDRSI